MALVPDDGLAALLLLLVVELLQHPPALLDRHLGALLGLYSLGYRLALVPGHVVADFLHGHLLHLPGDRAALLPGDLLALLVRHSAALLTGHLATLLLWLAVLLAPWLTGLTGATRGPGQA